MGTDVDVAAERFHQYVVAGCRLSMPRLSAADELRLAYWWNAEIAEKRKLCIRKRRAFQRCGRRSQPRADYIAAKKELRTAIKRSQEKAWADLVSKVESNV